MPPKQPLESGPDRDLAHFASRLRKWRADSGKLLKEVADEFGVAEATWSRWEKQQRIPSPGNLRLLAEFIGVPICCFFYPDDTSCPNCSQYRKDPFSDPE
jgi:transcriptional regulator with XRE-family HTH domain